MIEDYEQYLVEGKMALKNMYDEAIAPPNKLSKKRAKLRIVYGLDDVLLSYDGPMDVIGPVYVELRDYVKSL